MIKELKEGKYRYDLSKQLGSGAFACVYKGTCVDSD